MPVANSERELRRNINWMLLLSYGEKEIEGSKRDIHYIQPLAHDLAVSEERLEDLRPPRYFSKYRLLRSFSPTDPTEKEACALRKAYIGPKQIGGGDLVGNRSTILDCYASGSSMALDLFGSRLTIVDRYMTVSLMSLAIFHCFNNCEDSRSLVET